MTKTPEKQKTQADSKQERLEEALRANLHRRKAQNRGRKAENRKKAETDASDSDK